MARETKVGLLAGLAFIVCFAIILTNNGPRDPLPAASRLADAGRRQVPVSTVPASDPARDRVRLPASNGAGAANGRRPEAPASETAQLRREPDRPALPEWRRPLPESDYEQSPRTAQAADLDPIRSPSTSLSSRPPDAVGTETVTGPTADPRTSPTTHPTNAAAGATTVPSASTPPARRTVMAQYTVAPGDTLTHIATKHYGHGGRRFINAIVDANRSTIADPDVLRAGMNLLIPSMEGTAGELSAASSRPGTADVHQPGTSIPRDRRPEPFRWYQIKKNDRYMSIAREQLGDESRWQEIYELNKDKFPDAGMIREGVRIKLPSDQSASAEPRH